EPSAEWQEHEEGDPEPGDPLGRRPGQRSDRPHRGLLRPGQRHPGDHLRDDGRAQSRHGDAADEESLPHDPALSARRGREDDRQRDPRADERGGDDGHPTQAPQRHPGHGPGGGPVGDPEDIGTGQRVAEHPAEQRPGGAEGESGDHPEDRTRELVLHHDEGGAGDGGAPEDVHEVGDGHRVAPQEDAHGHHREEGGRQPDDDEERTTPTPGGELADHLSGLRQLRVPIEHGGHVTTPRFIRSMAMRNGTPMATVITPTAISPGGAITRPAVSASRSTTGPPRRDSPRTTRFPTPTRRRSRCGTSRPRNAMGPASAVARPDRSPTPARTTPRPATGPTPRPRARSSPRASASRAAAPARTITRPSTMNGSAETISGAPDRATEPSPQKR